MTDSKGRPIREGLLARVPACRRELLKTILGGAVVYSAPLLSSFSMEGVRFDVAFAQETNMPIDPNMETFN